MLRISFFSASYFFLPKYSSVPFLHTKFGSLITRTSTSYSSSIDHIFGLFDKLLKDSSRLILKKPSCVPNFLSSHSIPSRSFFEPCMLISQKIFHLEDTQGFVLTDSVLFRLIHVLLGSPFVEEGTWILVLPILQRVANEDRRPFPIDFLTHLNNYINGLHHLLPSRDQSVPLLLDLSLTKNNNQLKTESVIFHPSSDIKASMPIDMDTSDPNPYFSLCSSWRKGLLDAYFLPFWKILETCSFLCSNKYISYFLGKETESILHDGAEVYVLSIDDQQNFLKNFEMQFSKSYSSEKVSNKNFNHRKLLFSSYTSFLLSLSDFLIDVYEPDFSYILIESAFNFMIQVNSDNLLSSQWNVEDSDILNFLASFLSNTLYSILMVPSKRSDDAIPIAKRINQRIVCLLIRYPQLLVSKVGLYICMMFSLEHLHPLICTTSKLIELPKIQSEIQDQISSGSNLLSFLIQNFELSPVEAYMILWWRFFFFDESFAIQENNSYVNSSSSSQILPYPLTGENLCKSKALLSFFLDSWPRLFHEAKDSLVKEMLISCGIELIAYLFEKKASTLDINNALKYMMLPIFSSIENSENWKENFPLGSIARLAQLLCHNFSDNGLDHSEITDSSIFFLDKCLELLLSSVNRCHKDATRPVGNLFGIILHLLMKLQRMKEIKLVLEQLDKISEADSCWSAAISLDIYAELYRLARNLGDVELCLILRKHRPSMLI